MQVLLDSTGKTTTDWPNHFGSTAPKASAEELQSSKVEILGSEAIPSVARLGWKINMESKNFGTVPSFYAVRNSVISFWWKTLISLPC